jgi:uncharacterized repeat protein (TIGR03803 family)
LTSKAGFPIHAEPTHPNGQYPTGPLTPDGQGNFIGAAEGGAFGRGTIFRFDTATGSLTSLASFSGTNVATPNGGLVLDGRGNIVGTTYGGGTASYGTVFSLNPTTGVLTTLANFTGPNGAAPGVGLVPDGHGHFLGTTRFGGKSGNGTIFDIDPSTGELTTLASFSGTNGAIPNTPLVPDGLGHFLGTTASGRTTATYNGTVFLFDPSSDAVTMLDSFVGTRQSEPVPGSIGASPSSALVPDGHGDFFGTTLVGGTNDLGTIYELIPVPEPPSLAQAGLGVVVLLIARQRWYGRIRT